MNTSSDARPVFPRRGLRREQAAEYLGISASKFDELRKAGRVARAYLVGGRLVWDVADLDEAFYTSPREGDDDGKDWTARL